MMVYRIPAAPAAWAAAVMGPAIPPIEVTIVIIEVSILDGMRTLCWKEQRSKRTHMIITVTLEIAVSR